MLNSLLLLLIATSAEPALAVDDRPSGDRQRRTMRAEPSIVTSSAEPGDERQQRPMARERQRATLRQRLPERASPRLLAAEPARDALEPRPQSGEARPQTLEPGSRPRREATRSPPRFIHVEPSGDGDSVRDWRRDERRRVRAAGPAMIEAPEGPASGAFREHRPRQVEPLEALGGRRAPVLRSIPREGTQPPMRTSRPSGATTSHWRGDWRSDHRYDWRSHRRRHRWLFHFGFYHDPFGWGYRPFSIGWRMWPSYYARNYWLHDPWAYRLPYAPAGYRWIRYYDDALLVDTWDGRVVDVIRDFFW